MKLQQLSAISVPFVRKAIVFALIAPSARNDKIIRSVRPTAIQRDYMVYMVILARLLSTPITLSVLTPMLILNILNSVRSFGLLLFGVSIAPSDPFHYSSAFALPITATCLTSFLWIEFSALAMVFRKMAGARSGVYLNFIRIPLFPFALIGANCWRVLMIVCALIGSLTIFTLRTMPVFTFRGAIEIGERFADFTFSTDFHSVSLSPYHMMLPAGGVNCRFSGATLADFTYFTASLGGLQ